MPATLPSQKRRIFDSPIKQNKTPPQRKRIPKWVDVDDEDERIGQRKRQNGSLKHAPQAHSTPPRKKARTSGPPLPSPAKAGIQEHRKQLPIAKGKDALVQEIRENDVTVLLGETGSGKTTQVPQYLLEAGFADSGMIGVTQPRKVAATELAARVSVEQGTPLGGLVGYGIRFDERSGPTTRVKYMTDGMLTRELLGDPLLSKYAVIIVDEAHERTLRTDLLLANLKRILRERNGKGNGKPQVNGKGKEREKERNPLKVVIMSATLDAEKFSQFFSNAKIIYVKGRQHPVKIFHAAQGQTDYVDAALRTFFQIHVDQPPGDVLIFLPGQEDIESLEKAIQLFAHQLPTGHDEVLTVPMYAALSGAQLHRTFAPTPRKTRKCILATNIAETSITIPGVRYVIDTGKVKEKRYLAGSTGGGFDTLLTRDINKSNAMQRAGRAGREGPGFCYRLYTEDAFLGMAASTEPEILRCSLAQAMLQLLCIGQDIQELDLMDMPDVDAISSALRTLFLLGALDSHRELTDLGRAMAALPLEPTHARAVLASKDLACTAEVLDIVSVLSANGALFLDATDKRAEIAEARRKFVHRAGDHLTILNTVRAYRAAGGADGENANGHVNGHDGEEEKVGRSARKEWARAHFVNERTLREASSIRDQLRLSCTRAGIDWRASCGEQEDPVLLSLAHGLAQNMALITPDGSFKQIMGQSVVKIHPSSSMADKKVPAIIYDELVYTNQIYARGVSSIQKSFFSSLGAFNRREA
ncbi:ATP-dependent RNA helicase Prh1 [Mycena alexandri]|uniref:RNA helicase n=1 Tax=Mycena alexandri TaxID=1745969 RepID=A0AAD6TH42_9AGAR|nr:ATP-dependent RNA helicase Prh1 [Mycena alexandri]